jgi:hypothetical protein
MGMPLASFLTVSSYYKYFIDKHYTDFSVWAYTAHDTLAHDDRYNH